MTLAVYLGRKKEQQLTQHTPMTRSVLVLSSTMFTHCVKVNILETKMPIVSATSVSFPIQGLTLTFCGNFVSTGEDLRGLAPRLKTLLLGIAS